MKLDNLHNTHDPAVSFFTTFIAPSPHAPDSFLYVYLSFPYGRWLDYFPLPSNRLSKEKKKERLLDSLVIFSMCLRTRNIPLPRDAETTWRFPFWTSLCVFFFYLLFFFSSLNRTRRFRMLFFVFVSLHDDDLRLMVYTWYIRIRCIRSDKIRMQHDRENDRIAEKISL